MAARGQQPNLAADPRPVESLKPSCPHLLWIGLQGESLMRGLNMLLGTAGALEGCLHWLHCMVTPTVTPTETPTETPADIPVVTPSEAL